MILPLIKDYPKFLLIGDATYRVKFLKKLHPDGRLGDCDSEKKLIRICSEQTRKEIFFTFIHEAMHSMEFEHSIKIKHKSVHKYEKAIGDFLLQNF